MNRTKWLAKACGSICAWSLNYLVLFLLCQSAHSAQDDNSGRGRNPFATVFPDDVAVTTATVATSTREGTRVMETSTRSANVVSGQVIVITRPPTTTVATTPPTNRVTSQPAGTRVATTTPEREVSRNKTEFTDSDVTGARTRTKSTDPPDVSRHPKPVFTGNDVVTTKAMPRRTPETKTLMPDSKARQEKKEEIDKLKAQHPASLLPPSEALKNLNLAVEYLNASKKEVVREILTNASVLLYNLNTRKDNDSTENLEVSGFGILSTVLSVAQFVAETVADPTNGTGETGVFLVGLDIALEIRKVENSNFNGYSFPRDGDLANTSLAGDVDRLVLPKRILNSRTDSGVSTITSLIFDALPEMGIASRNSGKMLNGRVISTSIYPPVQKVFEDEVEVTFGNYYEGPGITDCVFWNFSVSTSGNWSSSGCRLRMRNATHTVCACNHLTDFSILFRVADKGVISAAHRLALEIVTIVGCSVSIALLVITIVIIGIVRKLRQPRYKIHINLAISLIIANAVFLVSDEVKGHENACIAVSATMFYSYMAAFTWMLCEGIFIWRALVHVFSENDKLWYYMILGWGLPAVIVGVSGGVLREKMISQHYCWLSWENWSIWAFVGPALAIIVINMFILIRCLVITAHHMDGKANSLKSGARLTMVLVPLLGFTWVFGVFAINEAALVFQYVFTALNSLQGFFIFLFYIILSQEARREMQKSITGTTDSKNSRPYSVKLSSSRQNLSENSFGMDTMRRDSVDALQIYGDV